MLTECARAGVRAVIIITAGFRESGVEGDLGEAPAHGREALARVLLREIQGAQLLQRADRRAQVRGRELHRHGAVQGGEKGGHFVAGGAQGAGVPLAGDERRFPRLAQDPTERLRQQRAAQLGKPVARDRRDGEGGDVRDREAGRARVLVGLRADDDQPRGIHRTDERALVVIRRPSGFDAEQHQLGGGKVAARHLDPDPLHPVRRLAQAGGIHQAERVAVHGGLRLQRVAGGARDLGDDRPLGAQERVEQRRLAAVGPAGELAEDPRIRQASDVYRAPGPRDRGRS